MRAVVGLALLGCVSGHGILTAPAPREGTQNAGGNKGNVSPCGRDTDTAAAPSMQLQAGEETTVTWRLDANHGGPCEIRIAPTDADLEGAPSLETAPCTGNGEQSVALTVPADLSGSAVLQWYWDGDGAYYDCADITVLGGAGGAAASAAAGAALSDVADPTPYAEVEVVFSNDMADVEAAGGEWQAGVIRAIAANVGIPASRIEIASIVPGSIRVVIRFLEDLTDAADDEEAVSADDSARLFSEQLDEGTGVMTDSAFACCYESHEITQWSSPTLQYIKYFVAFLLVACGIAGTLKFLQWKKETAAIKAELALRENDLHPADGEEYDPKTGAKGGTKADHGSGDAVVDSVHTSSDTSSEVPAGSSGQGRLKPPSLASLESRFFVAAASPTGVEGADGGWGAMRSASRQIQTARALGAIRTTPPALPARRVDGGGAPLQPPARPTQAASPVPLPRPTPGDVASNAAAPPRTLPPRLPARNVSSGSSTPPPPLPSRAIESETPATSSGRPTTPPRDLPARPPTQGQTAKPLPKPLPPEPVPRP